MIFWKKTAGMDPHIIKFTELSPSAKPLSHTVRFFFWLAATVHAQQILKKTTKNSKHLESVLDYSIVSDDKSLAPLNST